ncbi:MAG: LptF/LptG family permease [Alphaproteobacteria bacterium]|nr:MAG: LptF/LptG family permease [Alphaproteobacteria bacterium]
MMTLPTYVVRDVVKPTFLALGVMLGLVWLLQSLRFLDLVINKGLDLTVFLHLTVMLIPKLLTLILPLSLFVATCATLRRWQEDNELTAIISLGHSPRIVLYPLLGWALAMVVVGYVLFLDALPRSTTEFKDLQYQIRTQNGQLLLEEGTFNQLGKDLMVYLKTRETATSLSQLLVHDTRVKNRPVTWYARSGEATLDAEGYPQLILYNGLRQEVGPKQVGMLEFEKYNLDIRQSLGQQVLAPRTPAHEEFGLAQLATDWKTAKNKADGNEMRAEWHKRLLWPLSPIPLVLLAAAWLLRPPRRHQSSWRMLVAASLSGIVYLAVLMTMNGLAQDGKVWAIYVEWSLPALGAAVAWWIARRDSRG